MNIPELPSKAERHRRFGSVKPIPGTKPNSKDLMKDLQNQKNDYLFPIEQVGISKVQYPLHILSPLAPYEQTTIATMELTTNLERHSKGINMSRLTERLEIYRHRGLSTDLHQLCQFAEELATEMNQERSTVKLTFPWFYERRSPASNLTGLNHSTLNIEIGYDALRHSPFLITVGIIVSVTTLCPCSKEISEYSAHNQRGIVTIQAQVNRELVPEDWMSVLLVAAESNASAPLHPILKRTDEKIVTEQAYENPRFVEDLVRLIAADLYESSFISSYTVECRNEESIHLHDAISRISMTKP